jgi:hypothetical protein
MAAWLTGHEARGVELAARYQVRFERACQRDVHVVAAEEQMFAHRDALQRELAASLAGGDEREVGCATADVHHEDERQGADRGAPVALVRDQPRVEGRLWLLEQNDIRQPGDACRLERQLARHLVEGRRHREDDVLRRKRLREAGIPRVADVAQDPR